MKELLSNLDKAGKDSLVGACKTVGASGLMESLEAQSLEKFLNGLRVEGVSSDEKIRTYLAETESLEQVKEALDSIIKEGTKQ